VDEADLSVSPMAAPAALRIAVTITAMPTATSQPKKAAPKLKPPNASRWRRRASRSTLAAERASRGRRSGMPLPVASRVSVPGRSVVTTPPRSLSPSTGSPSRLNRLKGMLSPHRPARPASHLG
jgi:hypothetical protein